MNVAYPTDYQIHLFHEGTLHRSYELFGSHVLKKEDNVCTRFCVWAPQAESVCLIGSFNNWKSNQYKLEKISDQGIWSIIIDTDMSNTIYKYEIFTKSGERLVKADPYAFYSELRPNTASYVYSLDKYEWNDQQWLSRKVKKPIYSEPMFIYEVHLGSWKKKEDGSFYTYRELASELVTYVKEHGFTHIELLPLVEHPYDRSWGYQGVGYYSATSRYGTPQDLMYFIDQCHQHDIGVILDWVPGHFCKDAHGLYMFDGTPTYDYQTAIDRENLVWGTANFDLGKPEVQSFLLSNALFWMEKYHIDGFRVDAVANIIYWPNSDSHMPNPYGIDFLKKLNETVFNYDPTFLMLAEDSTDWPQVTSPTNYGGLGFNYKWNMGWMNDILTYMLKEPHQRSAYHSNITFSLLYTYSENFVLPLSHDEVVHGKKSLLDKMPGDYWQKFAQLRLLYGFMTSHPGKKLLFMGGELGQFSEWKDLEQLDWNLLDYDMHQKLNAYVKELLQLYRKTKPLFELDHLSSGFEWIDVNNKDQSIFSFIRQGRNEDDFVVVICNFTEKVYHDYCIGVSSEDKYREILNSDDEKFGGAGNCNKRLLIANEGFFHGKPYHIKMTIPPFGISILRPVKQRKERKGNGKDKMCSNVISRGKRK